MEDGEDDVVVNIAHVQRMRFWDETINGDVAS
jgi:hypothetical protein